MRIGNLTVVVLMAVSLCWVLFAQDQTTYFETESNLPEMMDNLATDIKLQEQQPAVPVALPPPVAPAQTIPRSIVSDNLPRMLAYSEPLVWLLNNPPTAPPAA